MGINKTIIVSVVIIMAAGLYTVLVINREGVTKGGMDLAGRTNSTVTKVIVGAYLLGIVVSVVDLLGGPFAHVGSLMLLLAVATALYAIIPDIANKLGQRNASAPASGGGSQTKR